MGRSPSVSICAPPNNTKCSHFTTRAHGESGGLSMLDGVPTNFQCNLTATYLSACLPARSGWRGHKHASSRVASRLIHEISSCRKLDARKRLRTPAGRIIQPMTHHILKERARSWEGGRTRRLCCQNHASKHAEGGTGHLQPLFEAGGTTSTWIPRTHHQPTDHDLPNLDVASVQTVVFNKGFLLERRCHIRMPQALAVSPEIKKSYFKSPSHTCT